MRERNIFLLTPTSGGGHYNPGTRQNLSDFHFIALMNRYLQADVVCITIYLKLLIIYRGKIGKVLRDPT